jgi:hypothetical protein
VHPLCDAVRDHPIETDRGNQQQSTPKATNIVAPTSHDRRFASNASRQFDRHQ